MNTDLWTSIIALCLILSVLLTGPRWMIARWILRTRLPAHRARRLAPSVSVGLGAGLFLAVLVPALAGRADIAMTAALCGSCAVLGALDWRWHWLPLEWTGSLLAAGLLKAIVDDGITNAILAAIAVGGTLWLVQFAFRRLRGREGLGTGDIVLMSGIATFSGLAMAWQILGVAALLALALRVPKALLRPAEPIRNTGVAFGTYLCLIFSAWAIFVHTM